MNNIGEAIDTFYMVGGLVLIVFIILLLLAKKEK